MCVRELQPGGCLATSTPPVALVKTRRLFRSCNPGTPPFACSHTARALFKNLTLAHQFSFLYFSARSRVLKSQVFKSSDPDTISPTQRVSQLFVIHRVYRMPHKLYKWHCTEIPDCFRCGDSPADHLHMFWKCPKLVHYWNRIINVIHFKWLYIIILCISVFLDEELYTPYARPAIS